MSIHSPIAVFRGYYVSKEIGVIKDRIVQVVSDIELKPGSEEEELEEYLRATKRLLHERLPDEEEFWIAYHPITRIIRPTKEEVYPPTPRAI